MLTSENRKEERTWRWSWDTQDTWYPFDRDEDASTLDFRTIPAVPTLSLVPKRDCSLHPECNLPDDLSECFETGQKPLSFLVIAGGKTTR